MEFTTRLKVGQDSTENVTSSIENHVGTISVKQITDDSAENVQQAIEDLTAQGATSFVLDLRNCAGGYISQAIKIADMFLSSGNICAFQTASGIDKYDATESVVTNHPVVCLVNSGTSAEAEVIAGALKYAGSQQLVGEKTAGSSTVQATIKMSFGGAVRLSAGRYLLMNGDVDFEGNGVKPTVEATNSGRTDNQLKVAKQIAANSAN